MPPSDLILLGFIAVIGMIDLVLLLGELPGRNRHRRRKATFDSSIDLMDARYG